MEIEIVTLALSILALVVSVLVFLDSRNKTKILREQNEDNRKKTEIMESQLKLLQEQTESKQDTRKALNIVSEMQERIRNLGVEKYDWGDFGMVPRKILEMLHDSGQSSIIWEVHPFTLFGIGIGRAEAPISFDVHSFEAFEKLFGEMVPKPETNFTIKYFSTPKIWVDTDNEIDAIQVKDYLMEVYSLGTMCEDLKSIEKVVSMCDASILSDLQKLYSKALRALYEAFLKYPKIEISSKIKTKDLQNHLLRFIAFDMWQESIKELKKDIRPRLIKVMKDLQESM